MFCRSHTLSGFAGPFFRNVRKELTKMPKVYFLDNGYRNSLINSYEALTDRVDKGGSIREQPFYGICKIGGI